MSEISISTFEKDIPVKYGMINFGEERELARTSLKYILTDICDIKKTYIRLGFHLIEFDKCKYYKDFGYDTFIGFCEANIPLDKSAISRCMAVCDAFCVKETPFSRPKMFLQDKYKEYNYSQLCEMVSMKEDIRALVKPDMTISQIRDIKKNVSRKNENVSQVATSQQDFKNNVKQYKGAVLQNYIKKYSIDDCEDCKHFTMFDSEGKKLFDLETCDILYSDENEVYLRLVKN